MLIFLALAKLGVHLYANRSYGYFRDELYYLACAAHLDFGYVDHPPLIALVARATHVVLGDSLSALRLPPAVAGALVVLLTGVLARQLGGGRFAQALAALAVLVAPMDLAIQDFLSMNAFDHLFWALAAVLVVGLLRENRPRRWLLLGLVVGVGLMTKLSMAFFCAGLVVGLVLTPARRQLRTRWPWLGALVAVVIVLPHVVWQVSHGWPTLEFMRNAELYKNYPASPAELAKGVLVGMQPVTAPIWLAGFAFYFFTRTGRPYRALGWIVVTVAALLIAAHGKAYYLVPAFPMLFAAGATLLERFSLRRGLAWLKPAFAIALVVGGLVSAPMALPVLPVDRLVRYQTLLGMRAPREERGETGQLPQHFADMFGWEQQVATVARVYRALPAEDRARAAILAGNYGEAGAVDFFGPAYGLPKAISGHNSYYLWGPGPYTGDVVIAFGVPTARLAAMFDDCRQAATITTAYAMPSERDLPVEVCRGPRAPLSRMWPILRHYI